MARPKKTDTEKKVHRHPVAMTATEKKVLEKKAEIAGMRLSPYLLSCGLNKQITAPIPKFDRLSLAQLAGIGNNLNQIAKHANSAELDDLDFRLALKETKKLMDILIKTGRE